MASRDTDATFQPVAGAMAAILPGLGYVWYADVKRAIYVGVGVLGLFLCGLLVAGIDAVDRAEDKWWFLLQAGVGPTAFVVDHFHQTQFKTAAPTGRRAMPPPVPGGAGGRQANKSVGRVNEAGMLMAALAGMLNIIAVIDCAWHAPINKRRRTSENVTLRVGAATTGSPAR